VDRAYANEEHRRPPGSGRRVERQSDRRSEPVNVCFSLWLKLNGGYPRE